MLYVLSYAIFTQKSVKHSIYLILVPLLFSIVCDFSPFWYIKILGDLVLIYVLAVQYTHVLHLISKEIMEGRIKKEIIPEL